MRKILANMPKQGIPYRGCMLSIIRQVALSRKKKSRESNLISTRDPPKNGFYRRNIGEPSHGNQHPEKYTWIANTILLSYLADSHC